MATLNSSKPDIGDTLIVIRELPLSPAYWIPIASRTACCCMPAVETDRNAPVLGACFRRAQWLTLPAL